MSCAQCRKKDASAFVAAIIITILGIGLVGGIIGMISVFVSSWSHYVYGEGYVNPPMNWIAFAICGAACLPAIVTAIYVNIPDPTDCDERVQDR